MSQNEPDITETSGVGLPEGYQKVRQRSPSYPFSYIDHPVVPFEPPRPDPTYTFWKHPNDTFPLGNIVYFIYAAGRIKIGYSDGLRARLSILGRSGAFPPVAVLIVRGTVKVERKFHAQFAEDRQHGEWFALSPRMRSFFKTRLCPVGRATLRKAEGDFRAYCQSIINGTYRATA